MKYYFRCNNCHELIVVEAPMKEGPGDILHCGQPARRLFNKPSGVIYRTGGFYTTDKRLDQKEDD